MTNIQEPTVGGMHGDRSPLSPSSYPLSSLLLSLPSVDNYSISLVASNDKSTNSGFEAGELLPVVHIISRSLTGNTHALYSSPYLQ